MLTKNIKFGYVRNGCVSVGRVSNMQNKCYMGIHISNTNTKVEDTDFFKNIENLDLEFDLEFDYKKDLEHVKVDKYAMFLRLSLILNTLIILLNV